MKNILLIALGVRAAKQIPSGHLYAALMGTMNLEQYQDALASLQKAKCVRADRSFMLHWIASPQQDALFESIAIQLEQLA